MSDIATIAASVTATASALASAGASATVESTSAIASIVQSAVPEAVASILPSGTTTTTPVTTAAVVLPAGIEIAAAIAGGLNGGLAAVERRFDLIGTLILAVVVGLGGGILRDVLLQSHGIYALQNPRLVLTAIAAGLVAFYFLSFARRFRGLLFLIDALSLGLFAIAGSDKALLLGEPIVSAVLLGTVTCIGGGIMRDVLVDEVPRVMRRGNLNATAALAGSASYVLLVDWLNIVKPVAGLICFLLIVGLRMASVAFGWKSPAPRDLGPVVKKLPVGPVRDLVRAMIRVLDALDRSLLPGAARGDEAPKNV